MYFATLLVYSYSKSMKSLRNFRDTDCLATIHNSVVYINLLAIIKKGIKELKKKEEKTGFYSVSYLFIFFFDYIKQKISPLPIFRESFLSKTSSEKAFCPRHLQRKRFVQDIFRESFLSKTSSEKAFCPRHLQRKLFVQDIFRESFLSKTS